METKPCSMLCVSVCVSLCFTAACGETTDPAEGGFGDSASAGETGGTGPFEPDVGAGVLDPNECLADPRLGAWGYKYQCSGAFLAKVGATYNGEELNLYVPSQYTTGFGKGWEPYAQAKVMACCGAYDFEATLSDQPKVAENCMLDFRQQACISVAVGLKTLIDNGDIPDPLGKATKTQNWIAQNTTACIAGLVDTEPSSTRLEARWNLPSNGPWAPELEDVYVSIEYAQLQELGIFAPEEGPELCDDLNDNNTEVFKDETQPPLSAGFDVTLESGAGALVGPIYGGGRISGSASFASLTTGCGAATCSSARFSLDSTGVWALDALTLFADGPLVVSNGSEREVIDDARVELYRQALGTVTSTRKGQRYTIPAGAANFVISGKNDDNVTLAVPNATDIRATLTAGEWTLEPFDLVHVDDAGNTWTVTVGSSDWL